MKLLSKLFLPALLVLAVAVTSCVDDDDDNGPSNDPKGNMTGDLTIIDGGAPVQSQWNSSDVTCFHDTLLNVFVITTTDDSGDKITLTLANGNQGNFQFQSFGENISIYDRANSTDTITTQPNDFLDPPSTGGLVTISTEDYEMASEISGTIVQMSWARIGPGDDDDESFGFLQNAEFTEVPVTRGTNVSIGGDASLECTVDGTPFNAEFVTATTINNMLVISASNIAGETVTISLPQGASTGSHDVGGVSGYMAAYSDGATGYSGTAGTIVLNSVNIAGGTATGTFDFTGTDVFGGGTVEVTNGSFSVD
jgi:hypothetical protein